MEYIKCPVCNGEVVLTPISTNNTQYTLNKYFKLSCRRCDIQSREVYVCSTINDDGEVVESRESLEWSNDRAKGD